MTVVLVHGNPETEAIWGPLIKELGRDDVICLSPPGFGAPVPDGFGATMLEYRDWLAGELEKLGEPVHLIGHDWGGGHVMNVVLSRPDLIRSWIVDVVGLYDEEYVWHDLAQVWQTPEAGERLVDTMMNATVEEKVERFGALGMPADAARQMADWQNDDMGRCILTLYRSATAPHLKPFRENLPAAASRPGLNILATEDHYVGSDELRRRAAARAGASTEVLEGLGHWWMLQDPARGAEVINRFLSLVGGD
ncbi:alpha/beta fold hydrolase [Pseudonocardia spinosispora]|uniref:alpha/beta fold hydrolase n=1 Tax=Pseudonocardia spinosispora TaxID=103441 RepID=UPI00048BE1C0|nr:alpha/beta hydrolase [Pseudonocardia spinosispora]